MERGSITDHIVRTFPHVRPASVGGDTFFFYDPGDGSGAAQDGDVYFATLKDRDDDYDRASDLDRPDVFRLNIGVALSTFRALFGGERPEEAAGIDYTELDRILPHPVYGRIHWVCVLNPSDATFEERVRPLLAEAYELAVRRHRRCRVRKGGG